MAALQSTNYASSAITLKQAETFRKRFAGLRDERGATAIAARSTGKGVSELHIHHDPGCRACYQRRGATIVVLLWASPINGKNDHDRETHHL